MESETKTFTLVEESKTYVRKFSLHGQRLVFRITEPPSGVSDIEWGQKAINDLTAYIKSGSKKSDQIGLTFISENCNEQGPAWLPFKTAQELQSEKIWSLIYSLFQSKSNAITSISDTFKIMVTRVEMPVGKGRKKSGKYDNFAEESKCRRGIVFIKNSDNLCLPRAIVVAKSFVEKDPVYEKIKKDVGKIQMNLAKELVKDAGVTIPEEGCGIPELEEFQKFLKFHKIIVYRHGTKGREMVFEGVAPHAQHKINLLTSDSHFNVITSLTAAFSCSYYCEECHVPFNTKGRHRCNKTCRMCGESEPCHREGPNKHCPDCNRTFYSSKCFDQHKKTLCDHVKKCSSCYKTIDIRLHKSVHVCGEIFCKICKEHCPREHQCFMKKDERNPPTASFLMIFYDFETRQEKPHPKNPAIMVHEPNLCVSQQSCDACIGTPLETNPICKKCCQRQKIITGDSLISTFFNYVVGLRKIFKRVVCIAHNSQAFDVIFILRHIMENTQHKPDLIMRGSKVLQLKLENASFIDSLNYFPMGLSKLPKAFGLKSLKKGYFPHYFNTKENQLYCGPIPAIDYYRPTAMFPEERESFLKWYDEQVCSDYIFDMQRELKDYCVSDVSILRGACEQFRSYFLKECNVDPFFEAITIASACNLAFRRNFLKPESIGIIPSGGYRNKGNQSRVALEWLLHLEIKLNIALQHAGKGREAIVGGFQVDGFSEERNEVYEFHGCYFHGCPKCFPYQRDEPLRDDPSDTMDWRYQRTCEKTTHLRELGHNVTEMWECDFNLLKMKNESLTPKDHPILTQTPLDPREAFYGGRTGCTKLYYKAGEGEKILYADVCSLYPYVCKYSKYPVAHPQIYVGQECSQLTGENCNLENVEGLVKCTVLPPLHLYHPVLPVKQNGKLMFSLCRTCSEMQNPEECDHTDDERALSGCWVVDEIRKAVEKGYKVLKIYEIWQYSIAQYNPEEKTGGLFTTFIDKFLKIKQEASGLPNYCHTEEDIKNYVTDYFEREGVLLDADSITENPGLRSLAKLMLNSFWGRFGMRENMPKTNIVKEPHELFALLTNLSIEVNHVQEINQETCIVNWQHLEEIGDTSPTVNVVLAAYTTAQARLKLYEYLEVLDRQVLYYDTDSVIYSFREGQQLIPTGVYLGEMTDELGNGNYITEFVSGGPKTYAYLVHSPTAATTKSMCKVKGLTLNFDTTQLINFESMKKMILEPEKNDDVIQVSSTSILRTEDKNVVTVPTHKTFRINVRKRKIDGFDTFPYGYKKQKMW